MKRYLVLSITTGQICYTYYTDDALRILPDEYTQIEISENIDVSICDLQHVDGVYSLVVNESKKQDKIQRNLAEIRRVRNAMIVVTDWTQLLDVSLDEAEAQQYRTYRQALRDVPSTLSETDILQYPQNDINWPIL